MPASDSTSVTLTRTEEGSHQLIVQNYSRCKEFGVNKSVDSEYFMVGGYLWEIRFFPNGKTIYAYNEGYASLYIALRSNISDSVPCVFEFHLLDQSGKGKHYVRVPTLDSFPVDISYASYGTVDGLIKFIKRSSLQNSDYLKDDCLKVNCTLRVLTYHIQKLPRPLNKVPKPITGSRYWMVMNDYDKVLFIVAGKSFYAHKSVLTTRSTIIRYYQDHRELVIPDTEPGIFKALLWFIYTATLLEEEQEALCDFGPSIFESFMGKMLVAADQFGVKILKEIYELRFSERVSVESVPYLLHLAERCHATKLKDACLGFLDKNRAAVLESNGAGYVKEACLSCFLDLAGYTAKLPTNGESKIDVSPKIVSFVKEFIEGMFSPHVDKKLKEGTYAYKKLKEV